METKSGGKMNTQVGNSHEANSIGKHKSLGNVSRTHCKKLIKLNDDNDFLQIITIDFYSLAFVFIYLFLIYI